MAEALKTDLCVIGAGSAGLSVAAGASQMGAETVLIERGEMGGDCLNYGCVPSKSLLAAGRMARLWRDSPAFGIRYNEPAVDYREVQAHIQRVIAAIEPNDSAERFEGLGVTVIKGHARFVSETALEVEDRRIEAKRFVIATGSQPLIPPIEGLAEAAYLTNETVFALTERPDKVIVLGGGPIGCELGQALRDLGAEVEILEMGSILPKDDPELVQVLRKRLRGDGITLQEGAKVVAIAPRSQGLSVTFERDGERFETPGSHLLVAAGRKPTVEGLDLERAGVAYDGKGITVDDRLRTTNRRIFAMGDVSGGPQFTHVTSYHAGVVIKNALFRLPAKVDYRALPWVTYTEPELAHVGLNEQAARDAGHAVNLLRWSFHDNDRAQTEADTHGFVKAVVAPRGKILGCSIVGPQAGELIQPWILAISAGLKIGAIAQMIAPYPTRGEAGKRAAGSFYVPKLFSERTRKIVRLLLRLP